MAVPQKINTVTTGFTTPLVCPEELEPGSPRGVCTQMVIVTLFTTAKVAHSQGSTDRCTDEQEGSIHTEEYYSAVKRKEILSQATAWMNPEDIVLSELSQSQKTNSV